MKVKKKKVKDKEMLKKDKEMMNYLVGYVRGKPFPLKHTFMDVDDFYGIRIFNPSHIFESTEPEPGKDNTRFLITVQDLKKAIKFVSEAGVWRSSPEDIFSIFDANKRHMGFVNISWYYYKYYNSAGRRRSRRSEWNMREYYLTSKYLSQSNVERKKVLLTVINMDKVEQKSYNDINSLSNKLGTLDLSTTHPQPPEDSSVEGGALVGSLQTEKDCSQFDNDRVTLLSA